MNSEFYAGWLDIWGTPHQTISTAAVTKSLDEMLSMNASVNMYMFHGGTHFGFDNGAEIYSNYQVCPTSYDYDAPLNEAGDPTDKYFAIKDVIRKYAPVPANNPVAKPKKALGDLVVNKTSGLTALVGALQLLNSKVQSDQPQTFEQLNHPYGLVVYETTINFQPTNPAVLKVSDIRDRGYVFVDHRFQGLLSREVNIQQIALRAKTNSTITILVENQGRVCFGDGIKDYKGVIGPVSLGSRQLTGWTHTPIPDKADGFYILQPFITDYRANRRDYSDLRDTEGFGVYEGSLNIDEHQVPVLLDTYVRFDGWTKGFIFINEVNIGRYWPAEGPQVTLYVPGVYLKYGVNRIVIVELEGAPENRTITFVDTPKLDGPVAVK